MPMILNLVNQELKKYLDPEYRDGERRFFKEPVKNLGVRIPDRRKVAAKFWPQVKDWPKDELFKLCEKLLAGYFDEATVALDWLWRSKNKLEKQDFLIFERWLKKYIDNWAKCDDFCTHSLGYLINQYPQLAPQVFVWTKSSNRWLKRAAAVTLIFPFGKPKKFLSQILKTGEALLTDTDDMVQKGYGWMLKEASNHNQQEVFAWVMKHKNKMPRLALRYAIEKMPPKLKQQAMI